MNAAQGFFPFLAVLIGASDPCTQGAPLRFTESDDNHLKRKRSHEATHYPHDTVNRGTVQSIRANGKYFINLTSVDFDAWFQAFSEANPTILIETDVGFHVDGKSNIGKTVNGIAVTSRALASAVARKMIVCY